ncbi:MAG: aminotransferase class V-fold PLP-dependent enzyme [Bacteroidetes bacterium]|nr:aminotransferase class V-fold PLP-dependent enzyme [Bacteroidota bacterium]
MTLFPRHLLDRARSLFPYLASGKIYLNHAATSPFSTRVADALSRHIQDRMTGSIDSYETDVEMVRAWRRLVQQMIHAEAPERIAFQMNTSDAINVVASGLPWKSGDHVLLNDAEFPANLHPFLHLRRHGVRIDLLPAPDGVVTPEAVEDTLLPTTRLVSLSAVQFLSGYRADLAEIGALCRSRGIIFVVDGIQSVGAVPCNVQELHIDALAAGAQKWQMSPPGTGFLYVSAELQDRIQQQYLGWLSVASPWNFRLLDQPPAPSARRYEGGTLNIAGMHAMREAISTLLEFGLEAIADHILGLTDILMRKLVAIPGVRMITPFDPRHRAGIVTIQPPSGIRAEDVVGRLKARGISIAVREGFLRFSPHFYNSEEEMIRTADEVRRILEDSAVLSGGQAGSPS